MGKRPVAKISWQGHFATSPSPKAILGGGEVEKWSPNLEERFRETGWVSHMGVSIFFRSMDWLGGGKESISGD